jgi:hypothetical protein
MPPLPGLGNRVAAAFCNALLLAALALGAGCQLPSLGIRTVNVKSSETYTNAVWHFEFPTGVGDFIRQSRVDLFNAEGSDIGVGYNSLSGIIATVFVYPLNRPPNDTLEGHFQTVQREVLIAHPDAERIAQSKAQINCGGKTHEGLFAAFAMPARVNGKPATARSELYLFTNGNAFVFYRFTYPKDLRPKAEPAIKQFMDELAWPEPVK